jgi:hypothetical protein
VQTVATKKYSMSVVVPYRDRMMHLQEFVPHMQRYLEGRNFKILVMEQADTKPFNRGKLLNIGFFCEQEQSDYVCFHDVDMLPVEECDYSMPESTTHLAGRLEICGFKMPYAEYLGGVLLVLKSDFTRIDGFSNAYWGWGEEDDDLWLRFQIAGVPVLYRPGKYASLAHPRAPHPISNLQRFEKNLLYALEFITDPLRQQIVQRRLDGVHLEMSEEFADEPGALQSAILHTEGPALSDGLSTLTYEIVGRKPLRTVLNNPDLAEQHEIISVRL